MDAGLRLQAMQLPDAFETGQPAAHQLGLRMNGGPDKSLGDATSDPIPSQCCSVPTVLQYEAYSTLTPLFIPISLLPNSDLLLDLPDARK